MTALHIASFNGNIGDIANHKGFYTSFKKYVDANCHFEQLEIREFYRSWSIRKFDYKFAELSNQYDLLIFGGGGFFRMLYDYSTTGTTIDISDEILSQIKVPILFNGIGVAGGGTAIESAVIKFKHFLAKITLMNQCLVSLRNDGSRDFLSRRFGNDILKNLTFTPDGGYFIEPPQTTHPEIVPNAVNIAINLGGDALDTRFNEQNGCISQSEFIIKFSNYCKTLLESNDNHRLIFVPHIPSDIVFIGEVLMKLPDMLVRRRVTVASLLNGLATDGLVGFDLYRHCDLVLGMRHHANVCSIGMNVPVIGIVTYESHKQDFDEIGLSHRCILVNEEGFEKKLMKKTITALSNLCLLKEENQNALNKLDKENKAYFAKVKNWLHQRN